MVFLVLAGCGRGQANLISTDTHTPEFYSVGVGSQVEIKGRIDVGDYKLFINCIGTGAPTVILEAGYGDVGDTWSQIQPEVAKTTRVCSYDRAGLGQSSPVAEVDTALQAVNDLHTLLENARVTGPYILVGHSWGGQLMRLFADQWPEEVVGLVLVDSSHPDSFKRNLEILPPELPDDSESMKFYREWFSSVIPDSTLPPRLLVVGSLGDLPLVVLTSPEKQRADDFPVELSRQFDQIWVELHKELAKLSSNSTHIIAEGSGHFIHQDQPELVIDVILGMVEDLRTGEADLSYP